MCYASILQEGCKCESHFMRSGRNSQRNLRNRSFTAHGLARYLTIKNDVTKTDEKNRKRHHCCLFVVLASALESALCQTVRSLSLTCKWSFKTLGAQHWCCMVRDSRWLLIDVFGYGRQTQRKSSCEAHANPYSKTSAVNIKNNTKH